MLVDWLQRAFYLPTGFVRYLLQNQRVVVGHRIGEGREQVRPGRGIRLTGDVVVQPGVPAAPAGAPEIISLFEDEHLLVVDKPNGLLIHGEPERESDTLDARVAAHYESQGILRRVLHVHRLDKDTSGVVLYAKHAYSGRALDALVRQKQVARTYLALVYGRPYPAEGTLDAAIGRDRHVAGRYRIHRGGLAARTHYITLGTGRLAGQSCSLLKCQLETGRTHQIRVHLASIGCSLLGDPLYGVGQPFDTKLDSIGLPQWEGQALHAWRLAFVHPYAGRTLEVVSRLPWFFAQWLSALKLLDLVGEDTSEV
jgi:23S rRNA pseudouridine1911/1915/1917 synthase